MDCQRPFIIKHRDLLNYPDGLEVPCGCCVNCRIQKRREWILRLWFELDEHKEAIFLTLTYDDDNMKKTGNMLTNEFLNGTLEKYELQKFFKRLRKNLKKRSIYDEIEDFIENRGDKQKIKYFAVGEYGEKTLRPHYHIIIFGISGTDRWKKIIKKSWDKCNWDMLESPVNNYGRDVFGTVTPASIKYICKYVLKLEKDVIYPPGVVPPTTEKTFKLQSKGLGLGHATKIKKQLQGNQFVKMEGIKQSIPRYFIDKLGLDMTAAKKKAKENEIEKMQKIVGLSHSRVEYYKIDPSDCARVEHNQRIKNDNKARHAIYAYDIFSNRKI